jgi:hypothetical protein
MKLSTDDDLWFDVNPNNFQLDGEGVNVYASFGRWANELFGHMAGNYKLVSIRALHWLFSSYRFEKTKSLTSCFKNVNMRNNHKLLSDIK